MLTGLVTYRVTNEEELQWGKDKSLSYV